MEKGLLKVGLAISIALLMLGLFNPVRAACVGNYDPAFGSHSAVPVTLGTWYGGACDYGTMFAGEGSWSSDHYVLTWLGGGLLVRVVDCCWYGDYYHVWIVDTASNTKICLKLCTPQVHTDGHHIEDPIVNPLHDGLGTTWSDGTAIFYLPAGTYEFMVRDQLFDVLMAEPGSPLDAWTPAGFSIFFDNAPPGWVVPEVPLGTIAASATMVMALVGFIALPRFKRKR